MYNFIAQLIQTFSNKHSQTGSIVVATATGKFQSLSLRRQVIPIGPLEVGPFVRGKLVKLRRPNDRDKVYPVADDTCRRTCKPVKISRIPASRQRFLTAFTAGGKFSSVSRDTPATSSDLPFEWRRAFFKLEAPFPRALLSLWSS